MAPALGPWTLRAASGTDHAIFEKPSEFATALQTAMREAQDIELLFAIWEQNVETVRAVNRAIEAGSVAEVRHRAAACRASQAMRDRTR